MVCHRCRGLLICDTFCDLTIEADARYTATRCLNCGCIEDAVVRANRVRPPSETRPSPRGVVGRGQVILSKRDY
jgi:hypothetical protein